MEAKNRQDGVDEAAIAPSKGNKGASGQTSLMFSTIYMEIQPRRRSHAAASPSSVSIIHLGLWLAARGAEREKKEERRDKASNWGLRFVVNLRR